MAAGRYVLNDLAVDCCFPQFVYGLKGIMRIFNVSKGKACVLKGTLLKDAVAQRNNTIIVDTVECLRLAGVRRPERYVYRGKRPRRRNTCGFSASDFDCHYPPVVYGLEGIMKVFRVSYTTAWRFRRSFLSSIIEGSGNDFAVDTLECLKLFGVRNAHKMIKNN